jgi:hypothetical protein
VAGSSTGHDATTHIPLGHQYVSSQPSSNSQRFRNEFPAVHEIRSSHSRQPARANWLFQDLLKEFRLLVTILSYLILFKFILLVNHNQSLSLVSSLLPFELFSQKSELYQSLHKRKPLFDLISNKYIYIYFLQRPLDPLFLESSSSTSQYNFVFVPLFLFLYYFSFLFPTAPNNRVPPRALDDTLLQNALLLEPSNPTSSIYFFAISVIIYFGVSPISTRNRRFLLQNSILLLLSHNDHT